MFFNNLFIFLPLLGIICKKCLNWPTIVIALFVEMNLCLQISWPSSKVWSRRQDSGFLVWPLIGNCNSLVSLRWFIQIRPNKFLVFLLISILISDIFLIYFTCFMGNHVTSKKYCSVYITYFKPNEISQIDRGKSSPIMINSLNWWCINWWIGWNSRNGLSA